MTQEKDNKRVRAQRRSPKWMYWIALIPILTASAIYGINRWLDEKSYEFTFEEIAQVAKRAAMHHETHEDMFVNITATLNQRHPNMLVAEPKWIFINAGGWMGSFCLLYSSLSEYVLLFGTAVPTSGHSGRYWARIEDTLLTGTFDQWSEGTTSVTSYRPPVTIPHERWEATSVSWGKNTWMLEYARIMISIQKINNIIHIEIIVV